MPNKIALFFDRPYVEAHFCFREMIIQFLNHGWQVHLFMPFTTEHPLPSILHQNYTITLYDKTKFGLLKLLKDLSCWGQKSKYQAIIATPQWALYWAVQVGKVFKVPVICLADEVFTSDIRTLHLPQESLSSSVMLEWKKREAWANQRCALTIALGDERFELTKKENSLPKEHPFIVIPNSPSKTKLHKSSFYGETLDIPEHRSILLHSGNGAWSLIDELLQKSPSWSDQFHVVFQGRYKGTLQGKIPGENVSITPWVLPSDLMQYATASADIGLMLYDQQRPLEARNGGTAGKLGLYLSCGLPIICCNIDALRWVTQEGCGLWVEDIDAIPEASQIIMKDYKTFSQNAYRVFLERFEYSKSFNQLLDWLAKFPSVKCKEKFNDLPDKNRRRF